VRILADEQFMRPFHLVALAMLTLTAASAQRVGVPTDDLDKVSVDELFNVQVTSVDRKAQQLAKSPAAVFVLTAADIIRSGATCIPEALQLVPGVTALQLDGRSWTVSIRGGARQYADKILVLIDGRSLFTPLFSGVMWDAINVPMQDIEQIEVVRGPGAVMWGPNAVNGVINIITKRARDTKGVQVSSAAGTGLTNATEFRWGSDAGDHIAWRTWGKFDDMTPAYGSPGYFNLPGTGPFRETSIGNLNSASGSVGFRADGQFSDKDQWMVQANMFKTTSQDPQANPILFPVNVQQTMGHSEYFGWSAQARWVHTTASGENTLQFSFDRTDLDYPFMGDNLHNLNVNYESRRQTSERNEVYWGVGFQQYWDSSDMNRAITYNPPKSLYRDGDAVVRDEWQFIPGRLTGSAGLRLDYNSYGQLEYQPSLRLLYTPDSRHSAWMAVSRAVRAPNRVDRDFVEDAGAVLVNGLPMNLWMYGSTAMKSEVERSVEAGYRYQRGQRWSVDGSVYWSYYERVRAIEGGMPTLSFPGGAPTLTSSVYQCNCGAGRSYGAEIWGTWQVRPGWRLSPSYSYLNETRWLPSSPYLQYLWDGTPVDLAHQGVLRSQHDLARNLQLDLTGRARSRDEALYHIPGVFLMDARIAWRPWRTGEFSVTARNLAGRQVMEGFPELQTVAIPIRRTFTVKWTQRF
jgi:iron complex outermembrane recepter protein